MKKHVVCHEIPIDFGDHILYLISAKSVKASDAYIKERFDVKVTHKDDKIPASYFAGYLNQLFIYYPSDLTLDYLVHELVHVYRYITDRLALVPDEESQAYFMQLLFKKSLEKLIEVNQVKITLNNNAIRG